MAYAPMYAVILTYTRPIPEVDAQMEGHRAWLEAHYASGLFVLSGRRVPRTGGVILARGGTEAELQAHLAEDPFAIAGVARYEIYAFEPSRIEPLS